MKITHEQFFCDHCDKFTTHIFHDAQHERDLSNNYQECLICHWWKFELMDELQPPKDEKEST